MIGETIEEIIKNKVKEVCSKKQIPETKELVYTDNFAEMIEKLVILHIRIWMLEDAADLETNKEKLLELEKKIDISFKQKRPRLVEAINLLVDNAIKKEKSLIEDSVKFYEGYDKK